MEQRKLTIAVIGAGHWGPNLIRNFHFDQRSTVKWVSDVDRVRLEAIKNNYQNISVTEHWQQAAGDPAVHAVIICTPTATHHAIAKYALDHGKHVFVEKPLATSSADALELVVLAQKKSLKLMVGHVFLFNPAIRYIKEVLARKELGEIYYLYAIRTNLGPIRGDVNALWDLAPHDISVLLYLLNALPESVSGFGSSFINPPIEDVVFAGLRFPHKVFANLHVSWLDPKKMRQLIVVGSDKMLVFDDMASDGPVKIFDKNVGQNLSKSLVNDTLHLFRKNIIEGKVTVPEIAPSEPLKNECDAFVEWILNDVAQPSTGILGVDVVRILERISRSVHKNGEPLTLLEKTSPRANLNPREIELPI